MTYQPVIPTPGARAAIEARIGRGEIRLLQVADPYPPAYPGDLIPRSGDGRAVLAVAGMLAREAAIPHAAHQKGGCLPFWTCVYAHRFLDVWVLTEAGPKNLHLRRRGSGAGFRGDWAS